MESYNDCKFGPNTSAVINLINNLKNVQWFVNLGKPHSRDNEVVRVHSWNEAEEISRNGIMDEIDRVKRGELTKLAIDSGRQKLVDKAIDLAIEKTTSGTELYTRLRWAISSDREGAIYETVLSDLARYHHFLDLMEWYVDGHWPCGYNSEGKLVVF